MNRLFAQDTMINRHSRVQAEPDSKEFFVKSKVIRSHRIEQSDWKLIGKLTLSPHHVASSLQLLLNKKLAADDPNWNSENTKLGLLDGQTYSSLNLDLGQFLDDDEEGNKPELTTSFDQSMRAGSSRRSLRSVDNEAAATTHFFDGHKEPSDLFVETFKNALIRNYWEN